MRYNSRELSVMDVIWNAKYAKVTATYVDWYLSYTQLEPILTSLLSIYGYSCEILIPGCGLSETNTPIDVGTGLYSVGYRNITNVDISNVVIDRMQKKQLTSNTNDTMEFVCLDVMEISRAVPPNMFDFIIDKGLLDTLLCNEQTNIEDVFTYLKAMYLVLRTGGTFVLVTHSASRLSYLEHPNFVWKVIRENQLDRDDRSYHIFSCVKS
ncbi:hypothetical protein THRCLA_21805 [Thraustotheca clavata]|uniref:Methyltransferase type 11 domain-containing protein n=1 Tax=Thraustotheca clavata TaxID=74557 RepID=A0A1V9ZNR8_9STRA|nr:hypothetical protein THRCLA_21805 [Thraustotheca clavata]